MWLDARGCKGDLMLRYGLRLQRTRTDWRVYRYTRGPDGKYRRELICTASEWYEAHILASRIARERGYRFSPENDAYREWSASSHRWALEHYGGGAPKRSEAPRVSAPEREALP
ncbi:MAG TPA: hypothetical protein VF158_14515 [Longimicrobiales bacterium]